MRPGYCAHGAVARGSRPARVTRNGRLSTPVGTGCTGAEERREPASKNYDGTTGAYRATCVALTAASGARCHRAPRWRRGQGAMLKRVTRRRSASSPTSLHPGDPNAKPKLAHTDCRVGRWSHSVADPAPRASRSRPPRALRAFPGYLVSWRCRKPPWCLTESGLTGSARRRLLPRQATQPVGDRSSIATGLTAPSVPVSLRAGRDLRFPATGLTAPSSPVSSRAGRDLSLPTPLQRCTTLWRVPQMIEQRRNVCSGVDNKFCVGV
jgi:hypothetical protein